MFVCSEDFNPPVNQPIELKEDGSNAQLFYVPVDPITQKAFCQNYGGYIRNDIQLIVEQQDAAVAADLISRLQERSSDGVLEKDYTDFELIEGMRSKRCQTASEMIEYYDSQLELRDLRAAQQKEKDSSDADAKERETLRKSLFDSMNSEEKDYYIKKKREKEIDSLID